MADEDVDVVVNEPSVKKGSSKGMLVITIVGLLVMLLTPLASFLVVKLALPAGDQQKPEQTVSPSTGQPIVFNVDALLVNIAGTKGTRILRVVPHLVMNDQKLLERATNLKPMIADRVMAVASSRTIDELDGTAGRERLKKDILVTVNEMLALHMEGAVVDVYFSEFLIQ